MTLESYTWRSVCINFLDNSTKKQNKFTGQGSAEIFNIISNKAPILFENLTSPLVFLLTKDFFTQFIKAFLENT